MNLKLRAQEMKVFFDRKTEGYDDVHGALMENKIAITRALPDGIRTMLDLGAGTGLELIPLFDRFPDACVTAIDISESMLGVLKTRPFADRVVCIAGNFFEVPLGCDYDAVISSAALHHFDPDGKRALYRLIYAALKPGGVYINSDRFYESIEDQEIDLRDYAEDPNRWPHMDTPLAMEVERALLETVGFTDITFEALDGRYWLNRARKGTVSV
ncbi:MAG: class I SAM-dependent methyltransferase [Clostridia bacterium]|nr:class I SAM-dependent methyltransferase [Clostridia bacterium]